MFSSFGVVVRLACAWRLVGLVQVQVRVWSVGFGLDGLGFGDMGSILSVFVSQAVFVVEYCLAKFIPGNGASECWRLQLARLRSGSERNF
ncbi:hypothetical protein BDW69DRAFT_172347, partial [Aspergillus filifer]